MKKPAALALLVALCIGSPFAAQAATAPATTSDTAALKAKIAQQQKEIDELKKSKANISTMYDTEKVKTGMLEKQLNSYLTAPVLKEMESTALNGNSDSGNIMNDGYYVSAPGEAYYADPKNQFKLTKENFNGGSGTTITDDLNVSFINIVGNQLVYTDAKKKLTIINKDGTGKKRISTDTVGSSVVSGNWIYYRNVSAANKLYKIRIDGSMKTQLTTIEVNSININNGIIYFLSKSKLYSILNNGTKQTKISTNNIADYMFYKDSIYFIKAESTGSIYRMNLDASDEGLVVDLRDNITAFNIAKDVLFCKTSSSYAYLYTFSTDKVTSGDYIGGSNYLYNDYKQDTFGLRVD